MIILCPHFHFSTTRPDVEGFVWAVISSSIKEKTPAVVSWLVQQSLRRHFSW